MTGAVAALAFIPGLAIGSFLNVVAARIPVRVSIVAPGSSCPACSKEIAWYDNIPVISYVLLRGRCRGCSSGISVKYPLVELTTAVLVSACILDFGLTAERAGLGRLLRDARRHHRHRPRAARDPEPGRAAGRRRSCSPGEPRSTIRRSGRSQPRPGAWLPARSRSPIRAASEWATSSSRFSSAPALGAALPVALMVGMLAALVPSVVLLARHGAAARKMAIPLGPFLAFGGIVALFAGDAIVHAYLGSM